MNMKEKRKQKKITLDQLSAITKISKGDLSKIENGKGNPTIKTYRKIAAALESEFTINFK
jgi:transcriptional regulator with XRE-family HTH domain